MSTSHPCTVVRHTLLSLVVVLAGGLAASPAAAAESGEEKDWHFHVTPYVWMASLEGDAAVIAGLPEVEVDASFSDILENTDFTLMGIAELRYKRVGVAVDMVSLKLTMDERTPGQLYNGVRVKSETFFTTAAAFYRFIAEERGTLDVYAGARLWRIDSSFEFRPGALAKRRASDDDVWADPILGARGNIQLAGPLSFSANADLGGFGAASDLTWQLMGSLDYSMSDWFTLRVGYRHLDVDYEHGDFLWDVAMSGPIVGLNFRF